MDAENFHLKVEHQGELRRFQSKPSLSVLTSTIQSLFSVEGEFSLKYVDEEGDLEYAIAHHAAGPSLRVKVVQKVAVQPPNSTDFTLPRTTIGDGFGGGAPGPAILSTSDISSSTDVDHHEEIPLSSSPLAESIVHPPPYSPAPYTPKSTPYPAVPTQMSFSTQPSYAPTPYPHPPPSSAGYPGSPVPLQYQNNYFTQPQQQQNSYFGQSPQQQPSYFGHSQQQQNGNFQRTATLSIQGQPQQPHPNYHASTGTYQQPWKRQGRGTRGGWGNPRG